MKLTERELAQDVIQWLRSSLRAMYPSWQVEVFESSKLPLSSLTRAERLQKTLPHCEVLDIKIPITAFLRRGDRAQVAIAEVQARPLSLKNLGPFLAHARLAKPILGLLLSPGGLSPGLNAILCRHKRLDILDYDWEKQIILGAWNANKRCVDAASVVPRGGLQRKFLCTALP